MQRPRTDEEWKGKLDAVLPEWRTVLAYQSTELFIERWREASGQSERTAYAIQEVALRLAGYEVDEILQRYKRGEIGSQFAHTLLRPYVLPEHQDKKFLLPPTDDEPRKLISIQEFESRMEELGRLLYAESEDAA